MRRSAALVIFAALLVEVPTAAIYARGFGGFHGGFHDGFHGGFHGFGGFRGFHGMGFRGAHIGKMRFGHSNFGVHMGRHAGQAAALGFAGHRLAHVNRVAALHGHPALSSFGHGPFARNAFASRHAWNNWGGHWRNWNHVWFGSAFWPFLLGDLLSFIFWPYAYYDPWWDYGFDWILSGIFWPGAPLARRGLYDVYGDGGYGFNRARSTAENDAVVQACTGLAPGIVDLPIDRIEHAVRPTGDQLTLLNDLKATSSRARMVLKDSCANEVLLTPVGRLDGIEQRFDAVRQALKILQDPPGAFYSSLTAEQRHRFDAIAMPNRSQVKRALCDQRTSAFSSLPAERIEQTVRPTERQMSLLDALRSASSKASADLQASCPAEVPQTLVERLSAADTQIRAMLEATRAVRPALDSFYASLDDEQKARLNAMGTPLSQAQQKL